MSKQERAVTVNRDGRVETLYGTEISTGPETYRLLLTHPPTREGWIEEIPLESIESIQTIEPKSRGVSPEVLD